MAAIVVWLQNNIQYHDLNNNKKTQTNISAGGYCHLAPIPAGLHSWRFPHQVLTFIEIFLHLFFTYILYLYFLTLNYPAEIVNQVVFVYSSWVCSEAINLFSVSRYDFNTTEDTDPSSQCYLGDSHKKKHWIAFHILLAGTFFCSMYDSPVDADTRDKDWATGYHIFVLSSQYIVPVLVCFDSSIWLSSYM